MSPLAIALCCVGAIVVINLATAVFARMLLSYRTVRASSVRAQHQMRERVARFAVEAADELPAPHTRFERRLLCETVLEIAHELSGAARARLAQEFAALGYIAEAERGLGSRFLLQRVRAAETIGELGGPASLPALRAGLRDREPLVRFACAHALTRVGGEGQLAEVLTALAEHDGEDVYNRGALAEILLESGPDAVDELRALLRDRRHPRRRRLIVVVLGELRAVEATRELIGALADRDDELCARACHALGKIGVHEAATPLADVAMDGTRPWFVRTAAAGACGLIGDPRSAGLLAEALDSEEWYPRNAAATALVRLEDAGLAAVAARADALEPESVTHYWGLLDAAGRTEAVIARAAGGERRLRRLAGAAARAGATARLEELAGRGDETGRYAATLLAGERRHADAAAVTA